MPFDQDIIVLFFDDDFSQITRFSLKGLNDCV